MKRRRGPLSRDLLPRPNPSLWTGKDGVLELAELNPLHEIRVLNSRNVYCRSKRAEYPDDGILIVSPSTQELVHGSLGKSSGFGKSEIGHSPVILTGTISVCSQIGKEEGQGGGQEARTAGRPENGRRETPG